MLRVQQLEAELPLLEKDSCQRDYLHVASNRGGFIQHQQVQISLLLLLTLLYLSIVKAVI